MKSYLIILAILFLIITPLIVIAALITYYIDVGDGIILLSILVFTMTFSLFLVTLKMGYDKRPYHSIRRRGPTYHQQHHQHWNDSLEDEGDHDDNYAAVLTPSGDSSVSSGPPKYDQLYPQKNNVWPFNSDVTVLPTTQFEPTIYTNPYTESMEGSLPPLTPMEIEGEDVIISLPEQTDDGLPSYDQAVMLSKQQSEISEQSDEQQQQQHSPDYYLV